MKILFLDQFADLGGAQRGLLDLIPAILERGWYAEAAVPGEGELPVRLRALGVKTHSIPCGPYQAGPKLPRDLMRFSTDVPRQAARVKRIVESARMDLLYVNGPRLLPAAALSVGRLPLIFHAHSVLSSPWQARVAGWSLAWRRVPVIACSHFVARAFSPWTPGARMRVVYNGVGPGPVAATRERAPRRIGFVGRIAPEKGTLAFLSAARLLLREHPACRFVVCGAALFGDTSYELAVRDAARGLPVEFLGWREDAGVVMAGLDVLAVPSSSAEAATRVILEAGAAGIPVVAYRAGGIPEVVQSGLTGMLVDPTPEALAAGCSALLSDTGVKDAMGRAARTQWSERFTLRRYQDQMITALEEISAGFATSAARR
jgi:glycosyltransferase involved in cell wall biosynthesis